MPIKRDPSMPPPVIGKIGPYTVFMTPPPTPHDPSPAFEPPSPSPRKAVAAPPPVKPPPQQIDASAVAGSDGSVVGFLRNAVSSVQNAHSSLDDHLARWFGLNQSKYQWALDDYYESKGMWVKVLVEAKQRLEIFHQFEHRRSGILVDRSQGGDCIFYVQIGGKCRPVVYASARTENPKAKDIPSKMQMV